MIISNIRSISTGITLWIGDLESTFTKYYFLNVIGYSFLYFVIVGQCQDLYSLSLDRSVIFHRGV